MMQRISKIFKLAIFCYSEPGQIDAVTLAVMIKDLCTPGAYQSITTIYALSAIAGLPIRTFYPTVCHPQPPDYTRLIFGRGVNRNTRERHIIMFTSMAFDNKKFLFNHYVPLIKKAKV